MKHKLVKKDKQLTEMAPWLAYAIGLYAAALANPITRGATLSATGTSLSAAKTAIQTVGKALTSQPAIAAYKTGGKVLGGLLKGTAGAISHGVDVTKDYIQDMNQEVPYQAVNKDNGQKITKKVTRGEKMSRKIFGGVRTPELASECIKLISKLTKANLKESKEIFKVLYKDFVMESSKYLKENTNPINTLALFKGYLESEWKKNKKKSSKS